MKRTLKNFRKSKRVGTVHCPFCKKCNNFNIFERDTGHMEFTCCGCDKSTIMPFVHNSPVRKR